MKSAGITLAGVLLVLGGAALADELPTPSVDYQAEWVDSSEAAVQSIRYSAELGAMLIEHGRGGMLRDLESGETVFWTSDSPGQAMSLTMDSEAMTSGEPTGRTKTVAGETCTVWEMDNAEVCLSDDNIPLESASQGVSGRVQNLQRVAQDESLFAVPEGREIMPAPEFIEKMMRGASEGAPF